MNYKWAKQLAAYFISFLLILTILITSILFVAFDIEFFDNQYTQLDISKETGMNHTDLIRVTADLLDYIRGDREELESIKAVIEGEYRQVFNEVEIAHMIDVKNLFDFSITLRDIATLMLVLLSLILFIYLKNTKGFFKLVSKSYIKVFLLLIFLLLAVLLLMNIDFAGSWDQFHYIFFDNDLWQLDPDTDIMINMMPEDFFLSAVYRVLGYTAACTGILALIAYIIIRNDKSSVFKYEGDTDELL